MIETTARVYGTVDLKPVFVSYLEVLLTVPRRSMDSASALLQRYVIGQDSNGLAIEKWMAEDSAVELRARKSCDDFRIVPA